VHLLGSPLHHAHAGRLTQLTSLSLGRLVPTNEDLAALLLAGRQLPLQAPPQQPQQQEQQPADQAPQQQQQQTQTQAQQEADWQLGTAHEGQPAGADVAPGAAAAAAAEGPARPGGASSAVADAEAAADWTRCLAPLQRLRRLELHSDLVVLGSCRALRGMAALQEVGAAPAAHQLRGPAALPRRQPPAPPPSPR